MSTSPIRDALRTALTDAMKARDRAAASVYRQAIAAIANASAVPIETAPRAGAVESSAVGAGAADVTRRELTETDIHAVVCAEQRSHELAATELEPTHPAKAEEHRHAAALLGRLLPPRSGPGWISRGALANRSKWSGDTDAAGG